MALLLGDANLVMPSARERTRIKIAASAARAAERDRLPKLEMALKMLEMATKLMSACVLFSVIVSFFC